MKAGRGDLLWLLQGEVWIRPWVLLVFIGLLSALAGANVWLVLRTQAQAVEVRVLTTALEASAGGRP